LSGEQLVGDLALVQRRFDQRQHFGELREQQDAAAFGEQAIEQKKRIVARGESRQRRAGVEEAALTPTARSVRVLGQGRLAARRPAMPATGAAALAAG